MTTWQDFDPTPDTPATDQDVLSIFAAAVKSSLTGVPLKSQPGIAPGVVQFTSGGYPVRRVTALMADKPPVITGGYGGWTDVERPGRMSLTHWKGGAPLRMSVAVMLDGFAAGRSVEDQIADLEGMARRLAGGERPPLVRVGGAVPHRSTLWVVEALEWGDAPLFNATGKRTRQPVTVSLVQFVDDDLVIEKPRRKAQSHAARKRVRVKKGESVRDVAKRLKISAKALAKANDIRDPRRDLKRDWLKLP